MEYLEGETLADRLDERRAAARSGAARSAIQIADALDKAHRAGHRPSRSEAGQHHADEGGREAARLRLAKTQRAGDRAAPASRCCRRRRPNLTAQGTILGTFQYMAPEQLEGQEADARTDIFAFGAVALRDAHGQEGVRGQEPGEPDRRDPRCTSRRRFSAASPLTPPQLDHIVNGAWPRSRTSAGKPRPTLPKN